MKSLRFRCAVLSGSYWLNEIFGVSSDLSFAGSPVLVCGDLYQLPPVKGAPIYSSTDNIKGYLNLELWNNLKVVELTEVTRQRGDLEFISFLNKIRVGIVDYEGEKKYYYQNL